MSGDSDAVKLCDPAAVCCFMVYDREPRTAYTWSRFGSTLRDPRGRRATEEGDLDAD